MISNDDLTLALLSQLLHDRTAEEKALVVNLVKLLFPPDEAKN